MTNAPTYRRRELFAVGLGWATTLAIPRGARADVGMAEQAAKRGNVIAACTKHWLENSGDRSAFVKAWTVVDIPAPTDIELRQLAFEKNLIGPATRGLTFGYGIVIRQGEFDVELLAHECRHVYQVEQAGSLDAFLAVYLQQVADFEYRDAPYEVDARAHAHAFATSKERKPNVWP